MGNCVRISFSIYIVFIILIFMNIVFGENGLLTYNQLQEYKSKIENNILELENYNESLLKDSEKLMTQSQEILLKARSLGWVEKNEGVIVIEDKTHDNKGYLIGQLIKADVDIEHYNRKNFMIFSIIVGTMFYIFSGFYVQNKSTKKIIAESDFKAHEALKSQSV